MSAEQSLRDDTAIVNSTAADAHPVLVPNSQASDTAASTSSTRTAPSAPQSQPRSQSSATDLSQTHSIASDGGEDKDATPLPAHRGMSPSDDSSTTSRGSKSSSHSSRHVPGLKKRSSSPAGSNAAIVQVPSIPAYRRKSNLDTSGRRISELSLQLKTRLTYAMIKVQNGWEQHSLDELESLPASALSSPLSTTSTIMSHNALPSPRTTMASIGGRLRGSDASREPVGAGGLGAHRSSTASRPGTASSSGWTQAHISPDMDLRNARSGQPTRTLAPAPDLHSRARPHQHHHRPTDSRSTVSTDQPIRVTTPTPQEKDAVDTLLFMSSPANSHRFKHRSDHEHHHSASTQNSPSRHSHNQFSIPRRSFGAASSIGPPTLYDRASATSSEEEVLLSTSAAGSTSKRAVGGLSAADAEQARRAKRRSYGRLETEVDVDRLLDQMRDVASSEEETEVLVPLAAKPVVVRM